MNHELIQLLTALLGSLGFALYFNVRGRNLAFAALGGLLTWGAYIALMALLNHDVLCYALAALMASFYAQILARMRKSPATQFLVPALIPLIPGGSLYYTMSAAVASDWAACFQQGVHTLALAGAIAVGLALMSSLDILARTFLKSEKHQ